MAINEFLPFGTEPGANVITQAQYQQLAQRLLGFRSGMALSAELNKAWRQPSVIASVLAQFMCDRTGQDIKDDGDPVKLLAQLNEALFSGMATDAELQDHVNNTNNPHQVDLGQLGGASAAALQAHVSDTNNPHQVTLGQLGGASAAALQGHVSDTNNPHQVTLGQLGGAPVNSPDFTGNPRAPTPPADDNDTSIANTAFVRLLLQSLNLGSGITGSLASTSGYVVLPIASPVTNQLILQYQLGPVIDFVSGQSFDVTFPTTFPNECFGVIGNLNTANPNGFIGAGNITRFGARLFLYEYVGTNQSTRPLYLALGR